MITNERLIKDIWDPKTLPSKLLMILESISFIICRHATFACRVRAYVQNIAQRHLRSKALLELPCGQ